MGFTSSFGLQSYLQQEQNFFLKAIQANFIFIDILDIIQQRSGPIIFSLEIQSIPTRVDLQDLITQTPEVDPFHQRIKYLLTYDDEE